MYANVNNRFQTLVKCSCKWLPAQAYKEVLTRREIDQMVEESGVVPKKKPPGLSSDTTFLRNRRTMSSLVKQS